MSTPEQIIALHSICECGEWAENIEEHASHILAALKDARYHLVKLPENSDDWNVNDVGTVGVYYGESGVHQRGVQIFDVGYDLVVSAGEAREFAAALLAAADSAEDTK